MGKGAIAIGIVLVLIGIWGSYELLTSSEPIWIIFYPLLSIGLGIAMIILYKEEGKVEQRKDIKKKK